MVPAVSAGPVVETTGAGDAFNAGLATGIARGLDLPAAVRLGCAVAGISVDARGHVEFDAHGRRGGGAAGAGMSWATGDRFARPSSGCPAAPALLPKRLEDDRSVLARSAKRGQGLSGSPGETSDKSLQDPV